MATARAGEEFGPVTNPNRPVKSRRPDPDAEAPAPAPAPSPVAAPAPAPRPTPEPSEPDVQTATVDRMDDVDIPQSGLYASMLASKQSDIAPAASVNAPATRADEQVLSIGDMIRLRKQRVDPFSDYDTDSTRQLIWIRDAVGFIADLTGRTKQEVYRDALLGDKPLPEDVLDHFFADRYGYPRPRKRR